MPLDSGSGFFLCSICTLYDTHSHCYVCVIPCPLSVCIHLLFVCVCCIYRHSRRSLWWRMDSFGWMLMEKEERKWIFDEEKRKWICNPSDPCTWGMFQEHSQNIKFELHTVESMYSRVSLCVFDCPLNGVKFYCSDFQCVLGMLWEHRKSTSFLFLSSICTLNDTPSLLCMCFEWLVCEQVLCWRYVLNPFLSLFHSLCLYMLTYCLCVFYIQGQTASFIMEKVFIWMDSYGERRKKMNIWWRKKKMGNQPSQSLHMS